MGARTHDLSYVMSPLQGLTYSDRIFSKTPPSPLNLKRGSTSPPAPSPQERAPTGKPAVLYSQTSFNFVDFRLRSAEHSSELDALLSLARELRVFMRRGRG